jgi:hypothetical protein
VAEALTVPSTTTTCPPVSAAESLVAFWRMNRSARFSSVLIVVVVPLTVRSPWMTTDSSKVHSP